MHKPIPESLLSAPRSVLPAAAPRLRFRPGRESRLFAAGRFFYCRPPLRHPQPPPFVIAFPRSLGRPLQAPLQSGKDLPYMAGMIVNARGPLDHRRHAGQRPQIGSETVSLRALTQSFIHLLELRFVKLRPTPCPSCPANPIWIILPPCLEPSAHALTADVEFTGDLSL